MKLKLAAATLALGLSQAVFAQGMPQACPDVDHLKQVGVSIPYQDPEHQGTWVGVTPNDNLGTNDAWTFVAGPVHAQSQQKVVDMVNAQIPTLKYAMGPFEMDQGLYGCLYANEDRSFVGVTINPPVALNNPAQYLNTMKK